MAKSEQDVSKWVVGLLVAVLIATALLPTIFSNLNTMESDTTNFSGVEIAIISVIGILILVGFLYKIMKKSGV
jgi:hypothetical protein